MFWARLQLLARLTLNTRNNAADQPARLAHLDDGNDRAILVQGDEGSAQVIRLGHRGTPSLDAATKLPFLAARPIASFGSRNSVKRQGCASASNPYPTLDACRTEIVPGLGLIGPAWEGL